MTFTKEELIERIAEQKKTTLSMLEVMPQLKEDALVSRAKSEAEKDLQIFEMALAALAGMEVEPVAYIREAHRADGFCYAGGINTKKRHDDYPPAVLTDGEYWVITPLYSAPQPLTTSERAELENYRNAQQVAPGDFDHWWSHIRRGFTVVNADVQRELQLEAWTACRNAMQSGAGLPPMQPMVIDSGGILRFKENPLVRKLLDVATAAGYGLNAMALEDHSPDDRMQLAQLIGYSLSGYGDLSYVSDESYNRAAAAAPQKEADNG